MALKSSFWAAFDKVVLLLRHVSELLQYGLVLVQG